LRLEDKRSENASEKQGSSGKGRETQKTVAFFHSAVAAVCGFCQKQHTIAECASLKQASRQKQREMATRYRLCFCCLKPGHVSSACKTDRRRKRPASKVSSAVVSVGTTTTERVQETPTVECKSSSVSMMHANLASEKRGKINRFQTIKARAFGDAGSGITVTCLLDTGAEYSFIREDVASALGVVGRAQPVKVEGFGGVTHEHPSSQVVQLWLGRLDGSQNAERYPLEALTVPSLCHRIPVSKILTSEWEHLQFLDPVIDDESSDEVHVVIGIDYYYRFLGDAIRRGKPGDPVAVETVLGWIICGPVNPHPAPETVAAFNAVVEPKVEDLLRRFWEIEEMGVPFRSESDKVDPEKRFREGLSYDGTRYSVRLLWKNSGCWLPDNFAVAERRLETLERRMAREPSRRDVHSSILHSYLVNGWAEEITSEGPEGRTWYLPHHVVSQQGPGATKHRIVFDASAKFKGTSLNEQLDSGLKLQADLLGILLRFRRFRVALQSDIAKMFLQVGLREEDRDVCRFLWRKDGPGGPIATYRLTRVCFSLACSPYLAMQVVNHHLREKRDCFGTVVDDIMAGMYVDDLVVSCDSIEEARDFAHRSSELLASGGFHLAKWASNAPEALVDRPTEEIFRDRYSCLWKTLGVSWNPQEDELTFRPPELAASQNQETKRDLLRTAASVFDPLGGLTPFTVRAKQMFQSLWQTGMAWDDNLPAEVELQWRVWKLELNELHCIAMPRAYFPFSPTEGVSSMGLVTPLKRRGRLSRAQLEEETKFPTLLPRKGMIVDLLIRREHNRQLHAGVAQTLAALRERFWILRGRSAVKRVLRTCGICRRVAARPFQQRMGDLPAIRVNPARPFSNVGIDFVGPLLVRSESSKSVIKKAYICLFTCMVVRTIHLEIVPDQTIESFLRSLRRFVARRGRPDTIQSDNFRTFHQANAFLKHVFSGRNWETVQRHLASERVEWIFITERSPWCGGYWERLVRSVKTALKATLGQCLAAPDELRTVLCEVEARVNDRPLTFVGSDLDEEMALTPAHFLIGRSLASFPDRSNSADRGTLRSSLRHLLRRWSYQQKLVGAFWKRWKREYVVTLSSRGKWKKLHEQPRVGDVVLVADYNTPRRRWSLGRIVELLTGGDGLRQAPCADGSEHLPQCVLDRADEPLPVSAAPGSSFSGVSPLNAPADQLVLKLFSALADEKRADERVCLLECSEVVRLDHFRGASPGHKAAKRGEKAHGRHVGNDLNVHCASYHAGEETNVDLPHAAIFMYIHTAGTRQHRKPFPKRHRRRVAQHAGVAPGALTATRIVGSWSSSSFHRRHMTSMSAGRQSSQSMPRSQALGIAVWL
ncbi:hypothetical protein T4D_1618, partial [Trichinella pseudospiralis]